MVVMRLIAQLVADILPREIDTLKDAFFQKRLQVPIHRRDADTRNLPLRDLVKLTREQRTPGILDGGKEDLTLAG